MDYKKHNVEDGPEVDIIRAVCPFQHSFALLVYEKRRIAHSRLLDTAAKVAFGPYVELVDLSLPNINAISFDVRMCIDSMQARGVLS
jgi:hypothetical protein